MLPAIRIGPIGRKVLKDWTRTTDIDSGYLIWNYMAVPFILADPDFDTMELCRTVAPGESLRRLQVVFLARVVTHAPMQTFQCDREGGLRRLDYRAPPRRSCAIYPGVFSTPALLKHSRTGAGRQTGVAGCRNLRRQPCIGML
jgi:hypothetical protein